MCRDAAEGTLPLTCPRPLTPNSSGMAKALCRVCQATERWSRSDHFQITTFQTSLDAVTTQETLLSLLHANHMMQPVDRDFPGGPLKTAFAPERDRWTVNEPGRTIMQRKYPRSSALRMKELLQFKRQNILSGPPQFILSTWTFSQMNFEPSSMTTDWMHLFKLNKVIRTHIMIRKSHSWCRPQLSCLNQRQLTK
jgi:hypothetical protein